MCGLGAKSLLFKCRWVEGWTIEARGFFGFDLFVMLVMESQKNHVYELIFGGVSGKCSPVYRLLPRQRKVVKPPGFWSRGEITTDDMSVRQQKAGCLSGEGQRAAPGCRIRSVSIWMFQDCGFCSYLKEICRFLFLLKKSLLQYVSVMAI